MENKVRRATDGSETSVPCYESYNHHYVAYLRGKGALLDTTSGRWHSHDPWGDKVVFNANPNTTTTDEETGMPAVQAFSEHNGNEARQSYHGLPQGMVQPIASPREFIFGPMQINTKNPTSPGKRCTDAECPLPRSSKAPPNAVYSGILECPCTTRTVKKFNGHVTQVGGQCAAGVQSASECFSAVQDMDLPSPMAANLSISNAALPVGCFIGRHNTTATLTTADTTPYAAYFNLAAAATTTVACGGHLMSLTGTMSSLVSLTVDVHPATSSVTITARGPSTVWFGVGIGATAMADAYAIVIDGTGTVTERVLGNHEAGSVLTASLKIISNTVTSSQRVVVMTRPMAGLSTQHYTFTATAATVPVINAVGATVAFQQHRAKATSELSMISTSGTTCVCKGRGGKINGVDYSPHCDASPLSDLLTQHNPTCDVTTYVGGMACCRGDVVLLDADQTVPTEVDEIYFKWRFYYRDWEQAMQTPTIHLEWQFGHIEYDVTAAAPGTSPADAVHMLTSRFTGRDLMDLYGRPGCDPVTEYYCADTSKVTERGVGLVMAGGHCHAPACLSLELINADTGQLICRVEPVHGRSNDPQDEEGYLWLPPCQWGTASEGLPAMPVFHLDTNFLAIKRANSSVYHYGVMAIFQARGIYL